MFGGAHVLILEDEAIIAFDLAAAVEAAEGIVVGPAGTVAAALVLMDEQDVSAAILDVTLPDGELTPVASRLMERGVPVIVHAGVAAPDELRQRYPDLPVYLKPTSSDGLVAALCHMMAEQQPAESPRAPLAATSGRRQ